MAGCEGVYLDRLCDFLAGRPCMLPGGGVHIDEGDMRLGFNDESSSILVGSCDSLFALLEHKTLPDTLPTFPLQDPVSEKMSNGLSMTLAEVALAESEDELKQEIRRRARTQWGLYPISTTLPDKAALREAYERMDVSTVDAFGSIPICFLCVCKSLAFKSASSERYSLSDLLSVASVQEAHRVAIGELVPNVFL